MSDFTLRRITLQIEEVHHEGGPVAATPHLKGAIMAVCANPFAFVVSAKPFEVWIVVIGDRALIDKWFGERLGE